MPGPGLELIGEEETAEVMQVLTDRALSRYGTTDDLGFRTMFDPGGDLATHLVVAFPTPEIAQAVTKDLGSITLAASGRHVYANMEHLIERRTVAGRGCAFDCPRCGSGDAVCGPGMLRQTDALLARAMSVGVGMFDTNLAPWGLQMRADADTPRRVADLYCEVAGAYPGSGAVR